MFELALLFNDLEEPVIVRNPDVIKKIPILVRSVEGSNPDWDKPCGDPIPVPFGHKTGKFVLRYLLKYVPPHSIPGEVIVASDYNAASFLSLDELKNVIELANYFECTDFVQCIGCVIASKLREMEVKDVAEYLGLEYHEPEDTDEFQDWMHPPIAALRADRQ